jgi:hypothetical protein
LGPSNPKTSPGSTLNDSPSTAGFDPYDFTRAETATAGAIVNG